MSITNLFYIYYTVNIYIFKYKNINVLNKAEPKTNNKSQLK